MKSFRQFLEIIEQQVIGPSKTAPLRTPSGTKVNVKYIDTTGEDRRLKEFERKSQVK